MGQTESFSSYFQSPQHCCSGLSVLSMVPLMIILILIQFEMCCTANVTSGFQFLH